MRECKNKLSRKGFNRNGGLVSYRLESLELAVSYDSRAVSCGR